MPAITIRLDQRLLRSLNNIAPAAKRQRTAFIRQALKEAIRKREYESISEGYTRQPDSADEADDWSNAEKWTVKLTDSCGRPQRSLCARFRPVRPG